MIEGSGSGFVQLMTDPDPGGPKAYVGSGSGYDQQREKDGERIKDPPLINLDRCLDAGPNDDARIPIPHSPFCNFSTQLHF